MDDGFIQLSDYDDVYKPSPQITHAQLMDIYEQYVTPRGASRLVAGFVDPLWTAYPNDTDRKEETGSQVTGSNVLDKEKIRFTEPEVPETYEEVKENLFRLVPLDQIEFPDDMSHITPELVSSFWKTNWEKYKLSKAGKMSTAKLPVLKPQTGEKSTWPELVGETSEVAIGTIEKENDSVDVCILKEGTVAEDYAGSGNKKRVFVWVDENGRLTKIPRTGE